jgi:hypothetical protein
MKWALKFEFQKDWQSTEFIDWGKVSQNIANPKWDLRKMALQPFLV